MAFSTLEQLESYFRIDSLNKAILQRVVDNPSSPQVKNYSLIKRLVDGSATKMERIQRALQVVEWKAVLLKYDLISNNEDVFVHWETN